MYSKLTGEVTRGKIVSLVSLFVLVLSLVFSAALKVDNRAYAIEENGTGLGPTPDYGTKGKWDTITAFASPVVMTHVSVLPNGKVLAWGGEMDPGPTPTASPLSTPNRTVVQIWTPGASCPGCVAQTILGPEFLNLYCSGHSFLPDGKLLVAGGTPIGTPGSGQWGTNKAALYNYSNDTWTQAPDMNYRRWYPTNITLPTGGGLVWGGFDERSIPDYQPQVLEKQGDGTYAWRNINLRNPEVSFRYYSWLNLLSSGKVLDTLGDRQTSFLVSIGGGFRISGDSAFPFPLQSPTPAPTATPVDGQLNLTHDGGTQLVYDKDKFIVIGGGELPRDDVEIIDMSEANPKWEAAESMAYKRRWHNSTILPDGKVLVTGGTQGNGIFNNTCDGNAIRVAEIWTPPTGKDPDFWTPMAAATQMRIYHSAAVLLPDGRVLSGGTSQFQPGGTVGDGTTSPKTDIECDPVQNNHVIEVFSPPYLFNYDGSPNTDRPAIGSGEDNVTYGEDYVYGVTNHGKSPTVSLIRLPSTTHAFNQNQGYLKLTPDSVTGSTITITIPASRVELVPGHYMMFVLNDGVPSVAKIIKVF